EPESKRLKIISRLVLEPRLNGISELVHRRQNRSTRRAPESDVVEGASFGVNERSRRRDLLDAVLCGNGEPIAEPATRCQRHHHAEQRAFICTENKVLWPRRNDLGVPVAENGGRRGVRAVADTEAPPELSCAAK